ncbi:ATP-binding cassette domain-containing protein [Clavibacter zhangzhiyongii]|uniref:ATP-binding cassette domain-containing protein n=1 Tax=Clavibacter zhangzhiyongii TaxID=2768071 RepID=UPI0039DFAE8A
MPQALAFPEYLTVREVLALALVPHAGALAPAEAIDRFDLDRLASRQTGGLSGGERRRVALACVVGAGTPVVVLDEPSAALDIPGRAAVRDAIAAVRDSGRTVLLASHDMEEVAALADTVVCLDHGRVSSATGPPPTSAGSRASGASASARRRTRRARSCRPAPGRSPVAEPLPGERIRWVIDTDRSDVVAGLVLAAVAAARAHGGRARPRRDRRAGARGRRGGAAPPPPPPAGAEPGPDGDDVRVADDLADDDPGRSRSADPAGCPR